MKKTKEMIMNEMRKKNQGCVNDRFYLVLRKRHLIRGLFAARLSITANSVHSVKANGTVTQGVTVLQPNACCNLVNINVSWPKESGKDG